MTASDAKPPMTDDLTPQERKARTDAVRERWAGVTAREWSMRHDPRDGDPALADIHHLLAEVAAVTREWDVAALQAEIECYQEALFRVGQGECLGDDFCCAHPVLSTSHSVSCPRFYRWEERAKKAEAELATVTRERDEARADRDDARAEVKRLRAGRDRVRALLWQCVQGMRAWGSDEDGIHPDAWDAFTASLAEVGEMSCECAHWARSDALAGGHHPDCTRVLAPEEEPRG